MFGRPEEVAANGVKLQYDHLEIFFSIIGNFFFTSCRENYILSEEEHEWMPYNGNEILVFTSNTGDTDTIFFIKKDTLIAYPEAQAFNGKTYEVVRIFARYSNGKSNGLIELHKSKDKRARLHFNMSAKNAVFYRLTGISIDSLSQQLPTSLNTNSKTYSDVYIIDDYNWHNFKQRSNYVTKLYWSKSEGLIRYDKLDGIFWELTNKLSHSSGFQR